MDPNAKLKVEMSMIDWEFIISILEDHRLAVAYGIREAKDENNYISFKKWGIKRIDDIKVVMTKLSNRAHKARGEYMEAVDKANKEEVEKEQEEYFKQQKRNKIKIKKWEKEHNWDAWIKENNAKYKKSL